MAKRLVDIIPSVGVDGDFKKINDKAYDYTNTIGYNDIYTLLTSNKGDLYYPEYGVKDYLDRLKFSTVRDVENLLSALENELKSQIKKDVEVSHEFTDNYKNINISVYVDGLEDTIGFIIDRNSKDPTVKPVFISME